MKKLAKLMFLLVICLVAVFMIGCKGKRSVKLKVESSAPWWGVLVEGQTSTNTAWHESREWDYGDYYDKIKMSAYLVNPLATPPVTLKVKIVEEYAPGFLYMESSSVKDEHSTNDAYVAEVEYDFSKKDQ